jgi:hypothetical protein
MIVEEILKSVEEELKARTVEDVRIGLGYTAVKLDDGACGLAATMREEISACCTVFERAGELSSQNAYSLAELALSTDILEAALGLAAINAVLNGREHPGRMLEGDLPEILAIGREDTVGMIGYFGPLIGKIKERCKKLYVFERRPATFEALEIHPDWATDLLLPKCSVAIISGTAVLNKTIDRLLELCRGRVAIVGPTTPLSEVFAGYGVSLLFGLKVLDADRVLRIVSEGGGSRAFGSAAQKVVVDLSAK